jgi:hypothetical protein
VKEIVPADNRGKWQRCPNNRSKWASIANLLFSTAPIERLCSYSAEYDSVGRFKCCVGVREAWSTRRSITSGSKTVDHISGDASAAADLNAVGGSPLSDSLSVDLAGRCRLPPAPAAYLAAMGNEDAEAVAEPVGIAIRHVDLVFDAVKGEANGLGCI